MGELGHRALPQRRRPEGIGQGHGQVAREYVRDNHAMIVREKVTLVGEQGVGMERIVAILVDQGADFFPLAGRGLPPEQDRAQRQEKPDQADGDAANSQCRKKMQGVRRERLLRDGILDENQFAGGLQTGRPRMIARRLLMENVQARGSECQQGDE